MMAPPSASSPSPSVAEPVQSQCPRVVSWGAAPLAVHRSKDRTVFYPHGLTLEIRLLDVCLLETIRVVDGHAEHSFSARDIKSRWSPSRLSAFQEAVALLGSEQPKRAIIFGPSHHSIQREIAARFQLETAAKRPSKRVCWGDLSSKPATAYGGWGLVKVRTIPNRFADEEDEEDEFELAEEDPVLLPEEEVVRPPKRVCSFEPISVEEEQENHRKQPRVDGQAALSFEEELMDIDWLLQTDAVL